MCTIVKRERKNQKNKDNISFLNNDKSEQLIASIGKLLQSKVEEQKKNIKNIIITCKSYK